MKTGLTFINGNDWIKIRWEIKDRQEIGRKRRKADNRDGAARGKNRRKPRRREKCIRREANKYL